MKSAQDPGVETLITDLTQRGLLRQIQVLGSGVYLHLTPEGIEQAQAITRAPIAPAELSTAMTEKVHCAAAYLQTHLSHAPTLKEVARAVMTNRSCLQLAFKQVYHTTIGRYSQGLRLLHAQRLLLDSNYSLDDIADETGYFDGSNLSKAFTKHFGIGPRAWRKEMGV